MKTATSKKQVDRSRLIQSTIFFLGIIIFVLLFALIIFPSWTLIKTSLTANKQFSFQNYGELLSDSSTYLALKNTLFVSSLGSIGATIIGVLVAWLLARTDIPYKRFWQTLLIVPYLIPPFIGAIAWVYLVGPVGYINKLWIAISGTIRPLIKIYSKWGIIFVMAFYSYPIAYMMTLGPLRQMNPSLEEAARISGASIGRTLRDIVIPLMIPSIGGAFLLIFMSMMANFGIPAVIGMPARYYVMTTKIFLTILNYDKANNLALAAGLSMLLVVIATIMMSLQRLLQKGKSFSIISGKSSQPQLVALGKWKPLAVTFLSIMVIGTVIAPLTAIFLTSITRVIGIPLTADNLTLNNYIQVVVGVAKVKRAIRNSLLMAAGSATVIVIISLILSYLLVRVRVKGSQLIETITLLPYAIPGTVVALALILAFLKPLPLIGISIYNTIWIIVIGYITRFLTLGIRSISAAFEQVHVSLEEAARMSGANFITAFKDIVIPLIKTNVFAGWFMAFIPALTELTLSILLFSVGNETLGTVVFGLHQEGKVLMTAALAFMVTLIVLTLNFITNKVTKNQMGF